MSLPDTFVPRFHSKDAVKQMQYIPLGNTGIKLSKLSMGGAIFGGETIYGDYDEDDAISMLKHVFQRGINYIDTAPFYGKSEIFLGKALKHIPRKAYYISTKVGRYPDNKFDYSAQAVRASLNRSLQRLNLTYVDFLIIHDIEFADDLDFIINETVPAVKKLISEGKVKFFGFSAYPLSALLDIIQRSTLKPDFILTYARSTILDNTLHNYVPQFQEENIGIINAGCLALGLLSNEGPQLWHPAPDYIRIICRNAKFYCRDKGVDLGRIALYYSLKQPGPTTHLVGMGTESCLKDSLNVLENGLTSKELEVMKHLKEKIFVSPSRALNWEGIEVEEYREARKAQSDN